jgi:hypothetical protein
VGRPREPGGCLQLLKRTLRLGKQRFSVPGAMLCREPVGVLELGDAIFAEERTTLLAMRLWLNHAVVYVV